MALKKVIYLSVEQYDELMTNGSITVNGVTHTVDSDNIYLCPAKTTYTAEEVDALIANLSLNLYEHRISFLDIYQNSILLSVISSQATAFTKEDLRLYLSSDNDTRAHTATGCVISSNNVYNIIGVQPTDNGIMAVGFNVATGALNPFDLSEFVFDDVVKQL